MSEKNTVETVNVNGELDVNGDKWIMEKTRSGPHTVTMVGRAWGSYPIMRKNGNWLVME